MVRRMRVARKKIKLPVKFSTLTPRHRKSVRDEYVRVQKGLCHHCGESLYTEPSNQVLIKSIHRELYPDGFFDYPIHLHHDHDRDITIGAVHAYCNAVLWEYYGE